MPLWECTQYISMSSIPLLHANSLDERLAHAHAFEVWQRYNIGVADKINARLPVDFQSDRADAGRQDAALAVAITEDLCALNGVGVHEMCVGSAGHIL